ncbi:hypothetical protein CP10139811_0279 [Chlamydia ibidis]|uniref:Uncharacterized protein n=2 Tax=Chlamydia ibidis TaxID=1405396 RepID=S7KKR4_9CHLA|nr:hypothetical protein [Chlamydia ibidis]EPP35035.1 hypothetical protein CP10139811_0279 [Chlamydia ibidis]EQM62726.1 hypothetical protein H359_0725 [Chlamydia ibidis 10-1398/6]
MTSSINNSSAFCSAREILRSRELGNTQGFSSSNLTSRVWLREDDLSKNLENRSTHARQASLAISENSDCTEVSSVASDTTSAALFALDSVLDNLSMCISDLSDFPYIDEDEEGTLDALNEPPVVMRNNTGAYLKNSVSSESVLLARSSLITIRPRASMECLDDISLSVQEEDLETSTPHELEVKSHNIRTQVFRFFIDLLKKDIEDGSLTGGKVKECLDSISGGMSRADYSRLLDLVKEGDFTSMNNIVEFCQLVKSSSTYAQSHELQTLFNFFEKEGGALTTVMLREFTGILSGCFGLPIPENLTLFLDALSNLYQTTHHDGEANLMAASSIVSLVTSVLTSETTRRAAQFCYDNAEASCSGNCGCTGCGCAEGEGGCGGFGSLLCGLFSALFRLNTNSSGIREEEIRKLEEKYSAAVVMVALKNLGVDTIALLAGKRVDLPSFEDLRSECKLSSSKFNRIMKKETQDMWGQAANNYALVLSKPILKEGVIEGIGNRYITINDEELASKISVVCSWDSLGFLSSSNSFDSGRLSQSLSTLYVTNTIDTVHRQLGSVLAGEIMVELARVLSIAVRSEDSIWLTSDDLMSLISIILAYRGMSIVCDKGAEIYKLPEIKEVIKKVDENRVSLERKVDRNNMTPVTAVTSTALFARLAQTEGRKAINRYREMKDIAKRSLRNQLVANMSMPWLKASGLTLDNISMVIENTATSCTPTENERLI